MLTNSSSSTSDYFSNSKSFNADGSYIPYSERYPEPEKEKSDSDFDRNSFDPNFNPFKNNYKYGDTNYNPNGTRPEYEETRRKIKDIIGGVPKVLTDEKVDEMLHNPARAALSTEFTSIITTQRGFQANSRVITTSDTMLEELINLKR